MQLLSLSEIRDKFNTLLADNPYWAQFAGSLMETMLATFIAQIVYRCQQFAASALGEGFISTATKRASIIAGANDRGYVITLTSPSKGEAIITNETDKALLIPQYTSFISDDQYPYLTDDTVTVPANGSVTVAVSQLEIVTVKTTVNAATEFYEVLLSRALTSVCHKLEVIVSTEGKAEAWTKSTMFRLAKANSKVYVMGYKPTEQLSIMFGDGIIGMIPPEGSTITLKVWCSSGDITLLSNQDLTPSDGSASLAESISVKTLTSITGGKDTESTEATRNRAQYYLAYDDQVVWAGDYTYYLKQNIPSTTWISAWGEEVQERIMGAPSLAYVNRIYLSGWHPGKNQEELEVMMMTALKTVPNTMNKRYVYVHANEKPFTIELTGEISASETISKVESALKTALEERFSKDSSHFDPKETGEYQLIKVKDVWTFIDQLSLFLDFNIQTIGMVESNGCNDFVYLDVDASTFDITYEEQK